MHVDLNSIMKKTKSIITLFFILLFLSIPVSFIYNKYFVPKEYSISFSAVFEKKIFRRTFFYVFRIATDSVITYPAYRLSDDVEKQIEIGDSIIKIKNKNKCFIKKKNGTIKLIKFENE